MNIAPTATQLKLIEQTYAAFRAAPRPPAYQITDHRCWECDEVAKRFGLFRVREVPDALIHEVNSATALMSPTALRYYMPRFIAFTVLPNPRDSFAIDCVLDRLGDDKPDQPYFKERLAAFSADERRAIADYIATRRTWLDENDLQHFDQAERNWGVGTVVA